MTPALRKILIAALLTSASAAVQPVAQAQTPRHDVSTFIAAFQGWREERVREFRMRALPHAQERAIIAYVARGECAVVNGFLFGLGWHHIPDHEQYTDEDALRYGRTIDALVAICETIKANRSRAELAGR